MRHGAVLRGGPLDGQVVSVGELQNEILGLGVGSVVMPPDGVYDRREAFDGDMLVETRDTVDAELKDEAPAAAMQARLFPNQEITGYYYFDWRGAT